MKRCTICAADIENQEAPALLFIGKFGYHYEICPTCEGMMDKLVAEESTENERRAVGEYLYKHLFQTERGTVRSEVVDFLKNVMTDKALSEQVNENRIQSVNDKSLPEEASDEADEAAAVSENEDESTESEDDVLEEEEDTLSQEAKKTPLGVKLAFLAGYLAVGGGLLAYGIVRSSTFAIVIASLIMLLGLATAFTKD